MRCKAKLMRKKVFSKTHRFNFKIAVYFSDQNHLLVHTHVYQYDLFDK